MLSTHVILNRLNRLVLRGGVLRTMNPHIMNTVSIQLRRSPAWKWAYVTINEDLQKPIHFLNPKEPFNYVEMHWVSKQHNPNLLVNSVIIPHSPPLINNFQLVVKLSDNDLSHYATFISYHTKKVDI